MQSTTIFHDKAKRVRHFGKLLKTFSNVTTPVELVEKGSAFWSAK